MDLTIIAIDKLSATLVTGDTPNAADCGTGLAMDAQPRTYKALTERPADFEGFFVPPRRQFAGAEPKYKALTERPGESPTDESTALKVPPGIEHIAA
jgi:hypothetical protein